MKLLPLGYKYESMSLRNLKPIETELNRQSILTEMLTQRSSGRASPVSSLCTLVTPNQAYNDYFKIV